MRRISVAVLFVAATAGAAVWLPSRAEPQAPNVQLTPPTILDSPKVPDLLTPPKVEFLSPVVPPVRLPAPAQPAEVRSGPRSKAVANAPRLVWATPRSPGPGVVECPCSIHPYGNRIETVTFTVYEPATDSQGTMTGWKLADQVQTGPAADMYYRYVRGFPVAGKSYWFEIGVAFGEKGETKTVAFTESPKAVGVPLMTVCR